MNASSLFDRYREFKTALNAETYLDCIKQQQQQNASGTVWFVKDWVLVISKYVRTGTQGVTCCWTTAGLGMQDNELHLFVCMKYKKRRPNMLKNIEPHDEHSQFVKLMSCQVDSVARQMACFLFKSFANTA